MRKPNIRNLEALEKKLPDTTRAVLDAAPEERKELIGELFELTDKEEIDQVEEFILDMPLSKEYTWTKNQLDKIEEHLFNLALGAEKDADQIKAATYVHDKIKGKAANKTDITSGGQAINFSFDPVFNDEE